MEKGKCMLEGSVYLILQIRPEYVYIGHNNNSQVCVLSDCCGQSGTKDLNRKLSSWRHVGLSGMTTGSLLPLGLCA